MISMRMCLVALAIVFVAVQTVSSLKCWHCDEQGKDCEAKKRNVTCTGASDVCAGIYDKDKKPYTLGCEHNVTAKYQCDTGVYINCKTCTTDLCNSSTFVAPSITTIIMFAAAITKMYF